MEETKSLDVEYELKRLNDKLDSIINKDEYQHWVTHQELKRVQYYTLRALGVLPRLAIIGVATFLLLRDLIDTNLFVLLVAIGVSEHLAGTVVSRFFRNGKEKA